MTDYKNAFWATFGLSLLTLLSLAGVLHFMAVELSAGSTGFSFSVPFFLAQWIVIILSYIAWYIKVNRIVKDMTDTAEMRKKAINLMMKSLVRSFVITAIIGLAAFLFMVFDLLNIGFPAIYRTYSVITMSLMGNITLGIFMYFLLPNRVTGIY